VRHFALHFDETAPPAHLPPIRGLLHARRTARELGLTVAAPDDETQRAIRSLGAASVEETPVSFNDAMLGYLGDRGEQGFFLDDTTAFALAGDAQ
jgi:hypothetical protein